MNKPDPIKTPETLSGEVFQRRLKEADFYVAQGLFDEAREIYTSLIHQIHSWMKETASTGKQVSPSAQKALNILEKKLEELQKQSDAFEEERVPLDLVIFRQGLKDADLYISHGLFDEAREIYGFLILQIHSWMEETVSMGKQVGPSSPIALNIMEKRLEELQRQLDAFEKEHVPLELSQRERAEQDEKIVLNLALALKGADLPAQAIEELTRTEKLEDRAVNSYIETADFLIEEKAFGQGIEILRLLLEGKRVGSTHRIGIFQKMASAYESMGDRKKAIETYRELIASDRIYTEASRRIEQLTGELRRIRLSIATVTQYPKISFIAALVIAIFFMAFMPFAKTVNNVDYFTLENDPDIEYYDNFKKIFGNDEFFIIAFEKDDIFTKDSLTLLSDITQDLEEIEDIEEVTSLANVDDTVGASEYFEVRKFLEEIPGDPAELEKVKTRQSIIPFM